MPTAGPLYNYSFGQPRTETTTALIYNHAVSISGSNPSRAAKFFDLANEAAPLWVAEDYGSAHGPSGIDTVLDACAILGTIAQFTLYSIVGRDGSSFSSGGSETSAEYRAFVDACAAAIAGRACIWVIEPDAIPKMYAMSGGTGGAAATLRKADIAYAVAALRAQGSNVKIYLNVGNSNFRSASEIAGLIASCGITNCNGISLNVAQTELIDDEYNYFLDVKTLNSDVDGCVINTGLCGRGPYVKQIGDRFDVVYINPPPYGFLDGTAGTGGTKPNRPTMGVSIGPRPTTKMDVTDYPGLHALLWTKFPGGSDGGAPTTIVQSATKCIPEYPAATAPDPGDLYPDYLELVYDAANGLDFSQWEPFEASETNIATISSALAFRMRRN